MTPASPGPLTPGQLIRTARESRFPKLTQQQLADRVTNRLGQKFTKNMVTKIEGDSRDLSFEEAVAFSDALGIDLRKMADDLYHNDPHELMDEALRVLDTHEYALLDLSLGKVKNRLEEILQRVATNRGDQQESNVEQFLSDLPGIIQDLPDADAKVLEANEVYRKASATVREILYPGIGEASADDLDINDIAGYDPETGDFYDGSA